MLIMPCSQPALVREVEGLEPTEAERGSLRVSGAQLTRDWQGGGDVGAHTSLSLSPGVDLLSFRGRALPDPQVAKLAKDRLDDFDLAALGLARPTGAGGGGASGARDDVPEHFYQCGLPAAVLQPRLLPLRRMSNRGRCPAACA